MTPSAFIRPADDGDLLDLVRLITTTINVSYGGVYPPRALGFFKGYHDRDSLRIRLDTTILMVAETPDGLVGTGTLDGNHIMGVFVDPTRQGIGIGSKLMDRLEGKARSAGLTETELHVSLPSRQFYEARAYRLGEPLSRDLGGGQRLDFWKARKTL